MHPIEAVAEIFSLYIYRSYRNGCEIYNKKMCF